MDATRWLSYEELGQALGITSASAKRLAIRRKWPRKPGNDCRARVAVPVEKLEAASKPEGVTGDVTGDITSVPGDITGDITGDVTGDKGDAATALVPALHRHIERLEAELSAMKAERAALREAEAEARAAPALRETVGALKAALEAERQLRDALRRDLALARRPWWRRLAS